MVCFREYWGNWGLLMGVSCFWLEGLAVGRQGNPICTDDFSV